jgi:D-glycero-alpha-D-manno-heptose 1-phosphate guanylyltransferase
MVKEAVIVAGGFGTRLKNVVDDIPKSMAGIGDMPFLSFLLDYLFKYRIEKIVLAVGYKHEIISSYFGDHYKDMKLIYSIENKPLGTGGALLKATDVISSDSFFAINGDTFFNPDLEKIEKVFSETTSPLAIVLKPMTFFDRYGTVLVSGNRISSFQEKKYCEEGLINGGIYLVSKKWLIEKAPSEVFSFEKDLMEKIVNDESISYYISDTYFIDIGVPEDYLRAMKELPELTK